jgi:hypothetical protein
MKPRAEAKADRHGQKTENNRRRQHVNAKDDRQAPVNERHLERKRDEP